jgi:hypothetical protein
MQHLLERPAKISCAQWAATPDQNLSGEQLGERMSKACIRGSEVLPQLWAIDTKLSVNERYAKKTKNGKIYLYFLDLEMIGALA